MKVCITGGSGKIGHVLSKHLQNQGFNVRILSRKDRLASASFVGEFEWVVGDLSDVSSLQNGVSGANAVIHMAGLTHSAEPSHYYKINTTGTENLLSACRSQGVKRFVHISTRAIGEEGGAYSDSKLQAEEIVRASGLEWTILRPSEVYGASEKEEGIARIIEMVRNHYFVPVLSDRRVRLSPVWIDDVVHAIAETLKRPDSTGKIYTLAGPEEFGFDDLVKKIVAVLQLRRIQVPVPLLVLHLQFWVMKALGKKNWVPDQIPRLLLQKSSDISQARKDLDYNPRSIEAGLQELFSQKNGAA